MQPVRLALIAGMLVFVLLGAFSLWRGLLKFRRAKELEAEPRFRKVAFVIRYTGWSLLLCAVGCAGAVIVMVLRLL